VLLHTRTYTSLNSSQLQKIPRVDLDETLCLREPLQMNSIAHKWHDADAWPPQAQYLIIEMYVQTYQHGAPSGTNSPAFTASPEKST